MGFFDFFKKPKQKEESLLVKTLKLAEIEPFLDKKAEETNKELTNSIEVIKKEISDELNKLKNNLSILETAEVKNDKIPQRARQIMQGNRQIYLQKTSLLIEKIALPENPQELLAFIEKFDKELDLFDKSISKSHHILEEFFLEKASVIATSIKNLDKLLKEIKKLINSSDLSKIESLKKQSSSLLEKINKTEENKIELNKIQNEINQIKKEITQKENQLSNIQQQGSYKNTLLLTKTKAELEVELQKLVSNFRYSFSEISPALKKYENLSKNKIVKSYLEDPVSALFEDRDIEILKILEAIQKAIIKHEITLKEEKRSRIMNELFNLKKDFFEEFLTKRREVNSRLSEITTLIENSQILKDIAELEKSIAESKSLLQEKTLTYEKMNKDIKTFDPENLIDELERELNEKLKIDIRII